MFAKLKLFKELDLTNDVSVFGLSKGLSAIYITTIFEQLAGNLLVIVNDNSDVNALYNELLDYNSNVLTFPMDNIAMVDALAVSPEFMQERYDTIIKLSTKTNYIVITSLEGYQHQILNKQDYLAKTLHLQVGKELDLHILEQFLFDNLYQKTSVVMNSGEYAIRGHIVDMFLDNFEYPIRIEFWGDEIDSIRKFDIDSQRTITTIDKVAIYPNPDIYQASTATISDYCLDYEVVIDYQQILTRAQTESAFSDFLPNFNCYINIVDSDLTLEVRKEFYESNLVTSFNNNFKLLNAFVDYKLKHKFLVIFALDFVKQIEVIKESMIVPINIASSLDDLDYTKLNVIVKHLNSSIDFIDRKVTIINSKDIFNKTIYKKKYANKFKFASKIEREDELNVGDYIVHDMHGIGQYEGLSTIVSDGVKTDFFMISYRNNDKLYVPIEQINLIQKYVANSEYTPKINKLGSSEWETTKRKLKGRIDEISKQLLEIYAKRHQAVGFACAPDSVDAVVFENEFEFNETADQLRAVKEIKQDLESTKVMDRLLCGDVGFGKTEVAFRAAFKVMDNNKQVMYLCPTTVLSIQQYHAAVNRFANVGINIAVLNRYVSDSKKKEIYEKLKTRRIDLIIGTHSVLNSKIEFKDLGLVIVDEEQRFGVLHKDKLKEAMPNIDILTLSATPIPRTLQMSLLGIRDLSIIDTAPVNRFPIQTYVLGYSKQVIKEAIKNELQRNGQVFILNNVISKQKQLKKLIEELVLEAKVEIANGKMNKDQLEDIFYRFNQNEFNVLVATTIIETGINIPNANTLIVLDAHKFGLAQLYQIRGRVGRGEKIAYAYLMYDTSKVLTKAASARLEAIKNFTTLGSGYKIASRDLAIRGAGDIIGAKQSGFIDTIGMSMFLKMLNDALGKTQQEVDEVSNNLITFSNHIPDSYVKDDDIKLNIHKKINAISDLNSYNDVLTELNDLYGKVPVEIQDYMDKIYFNVILTEFGVIKVDEQKRLVKVLVNQVRLDGQKLLLSATKVGRQIRLTNKQDVIYIVIDKTKTTDWQRDLLELIEEYHS